MAATLSGKQVAVLAAGKVGGILLQALLKNGLLSTKHTTATVAHEDRAKALGRKLGIRVGTDNVKAAENADMILISVKPQVVEEVASQLRGHLSPGQLVISVAASVPNSLIEKALNAEIPVIRAMPNRSGPTPAGCTVDGLMELEEGKLRVTLIKAVVKATQRAKELAYTS